jgi:hypothetical protein
VAICHLPFAICHLPSAICHLPSSIRSKAVSLEIKTLRAPPHAVPYGNNDGRNNDATLNH